MISTARALPAPAGRSPRTQSMVRPSMNSRVVGMILPRMIAETACAAPSMESKSTSMVFFASGSGSSLMTILVMIPRVPSEPHISLVRS
jgi:hypothetical protein